MTIKHAGHRVRNNLEIRTRHNMVASGTRPKDTPLEGHETMVFDIICKQFKHQIIHDSGLSPKEADEQLDALVSLYGKRAVLEFFIEPPMVLGVPYQAFVINAIACMAVFLYTQNFNLLTTIAPVIHLCFYLYYKKTHTQMRDEKINEILTTGIKI